MPDEAPFLLIGGGLAGAGTARALRDEGFDGPVVLVGAEPHPPYERPPLSKKYLLGEADRDTVFVTEPSWYADNGVDLRTGTRAVALDTAGHRVTLEDGEELSYRRLLLATGARPRPLTVPGADQLDLHYLRTLDDSDRLRSALTPGTRVVIIGGGWIGLETAAAARTLGADVTVLEGAELPLLRVLGPEIAGVFADLHHRHAVDLRCGTQVVAIRPAGPAGSAAGTVVLADGTEVEADVVVVGIGAVPEDALARAGGLAVDDGIVVDEQLRSSDPDVFAAGDVANAAHPFLGRRLRVEHWANALNQPRTAALAMLGRPAEYDRLPYFYSDQYDLGMEYTGHAVPGGYDEVVIRGDVGARQFIAFWLAQGRVLAGMNVNVWDVTEPIRDLIRSRRLVDRAALADPAVPLAELRRVAP
jgi:3-phenylpropionate/trans-cinnamate dioxygenase ferredoxin reductase component